MKHATFIHAINSARKLVRLAQVVEQWTGNQKVGGPCPSSSHLNFRELMEFVLISFNKPDVRKILNNAITCWNKNFVCN